VHDRSTFLVFVPAYFATYTYGTRNKQGTSGVLVPQTFDALIGALTAPEGSGE
jgi:hypothetical protein